MEDHIILGVHINDRFRHVSLVQNLFTEYGCNIKTRLGLHEVENVCSPNGLVLLELVGERARCDELERKLTAVDGVDVKKMVFPHD
jgi:hypothetical protein